MTKTKRRRNSGAESAEQLAEQATTPAPITSEDTSGEGSIVPIRLSNSLVRRIDSIVAGIIEAEPCSSASRATVIRGVLLGTTTLDGLEAKYRASSKR